MTQDPGVFISYAGPDVGWANWVHNELLALGLRAELDRSNWKRGDNLVNKINIALTKNQIFLPLWSTHYFSDGRWTLDEINAAYIRVRESTLAMIPLYIETEFTVPALFRSFSAGNLFGLTENAARHELRMVLEAHVGRRLRTRGLPKAQVQFPGVSDAPKKSIALAISDTSASLLKQARQKARSAISLSTASGNAIDFLAFQLKKLSRSYNNEPPSTILTQLLPLIDELVLIETLSQNNPSALADVFVMKSRAFGLQSYACLDMGDSEAAYASVLAMETHASRAGHAELTAWALGTKALIFRFEGQDGKAFQSISEGLQLGLSGMARARLHCQEALYWSEMGNLQGTLNAIGMSDSVVEGPPQSPDEADGIFFFSRAKHHYYAGSGLLRFYPDNSSRAEEESRRALRLFSQGDEDTKSISDELVATVHLATSIYRQGRVEEILTSLQPLLTVEPAYRTSWHLWWLQRLGNNLENNDRYRTSDVTGFLLSAIEDFRRGMAISNETSIETGTAAIRDGDEE